MSAHYDLMPLSSGWVEPKNRRRLEDMGLAIPDNWQVSRNPTVSEVLSVIQQLAEERRLNVEEEFHVAGDDLDAILAVEDDETFLSVEDYAKDGNENTPRHISFTYGSAGLVLTVCECLAQVCGPFLLTMDGAFFVIVDVGTRPNVDWVSADF